MWRSMSSKPPPKNLLFVQNEESRRERSSAPANRRQMGEAAPAAGQHEVAARRGRSVRAKERKEARLLAHAGGVVGLTSSFHFEEP